MTFLMSRADELVGVVHDGGLGPLVASLLGDAPDRVVAWCPPLGTDWGEGPMTASHREAVAAQAEALGYARMLHSDHRPIGGVISPGSGLERSALLLSAAADVAGEGCTRLIWPVMCGGDLELLCATTEKAHLIGRLLSIDPAGDAGDPITVDTPLADLTRVQVAELAYDLDAPIGLCWWRREGAEAVPGWAETGRVWQSALLAASRAMSAA